MSYFNRTSRRQLMTVLSVLSVLAVLALLGCSTSNASSSAASSSRRPAAQVTVASSAQRAGAVAQTRAGDLPALTFTSASGAVAPLFVEIADTEALRETGLMSRSQMADDHGMIFMFSREVEIGFWMKDTLIDLSVAFINAQGTIVDIQEMQAQSLDTHLPAAPYQYAVEANATWYARHQIAVGDTVDVSQAVQKSPVFGSASAAASPTP